MFPVVERVFSIWLTRIRYLWRSGLASIFRCAPSPFNLRPLTDQQRKLQGDEFVESIDTDAICALASKFNGGLSCSIRCRRQGSFNVCFILDFSDHTTRVVRLPIEPAVHDVWDKVRSEVYTMQYVREHTNIPVPRVYAYGHSRLRRGTSTHQVFIVLDYIDGQPLTKKMLRDSSEESRRQFFGEVVDMFAQLRGIEFPRGGSLMPNATVGIWARLRTFMFLREEIFTPQSTLGLKSGPKIVGAFSMRKNELQVDGYKAPRFTAATTEEFFEEQYHLLQYMWRMPSQELRREEAEREEFALHLIIEEAQKAFPLKAGSSEDLFCLSHPDLRVNNIIVDDKLHIRGVIDWEFSVTVPRHVFLPPLWISGLDTGSTDSNIDLLSEFMSVLASMSQLSSSHSRLAQEWDFRDDLRLPMGYIFLDPSDLVLLFYRCIYPKLYNEPRDKVVPTFFRRPENKKLQVRLERRLRASEQYTQYLEDNNLFDDEEEAEWQQARGWITKAQTEVQGMQEWTSEAQDTIDRLDGERVVQRGQEQQV